MKTKILIASAIISISVLSPATIFAQGPNSPTARPKVMQEIRQDLRATQSQTRFEYQKNRIINSQNRLLNSFTVRASAFKRYQAVIQQRLDAKFIKFSASNQNLVNAKTKLAAITTLTSTYNQDLSTYQSTIAKIATSTEPKSLLPALKSQAKAIEKDLKSIRQSLVEALRLVVKAK